MTDILLLIFIFIAAGVLAVPIASRLGLGSVLGYLIAGIVLSPILQLLHVDVMAIQHFAEFGVVMMLFLVGLELKPKALWDMRVRLVGLGGGQVVLTTAAITAIAHFLGLEFYTALAVGLILALSSTAIVLQTLSEKALLGSDAGRASFSVLLMQDIAVIPMLALFPLLAMPELLELQSHHADDGHGSGLSLVEGLADWQKTLVTIVAVGSIIGGGRFLTAPVFRFIAGAGLRELFTAAALMIVVGIALLMALVGLSPALGTFIAGVVLANSAYRHQLESDIEPFKGLLLGLFFITVGAGIDFNTLMANPLVIIGLTVGVMALKALVLLGLSLVFRLGSRDRWLFALALAQAGEFGFVLLSFSVLSGVLPADLAQQLLLVVTLSMLLTPGLFILHDRLMRRKSAEPDLPQDADEIPPGKIIIAGAGRMGGLVDLMLEACGYQCTVIDYSTKRIQITQRFGVKHYFGDPTRPEILRAAGIAEADLVIVAIDGKDKINQLVQHVLENHPNVHVITRAEDRNHVYDLWSFGCRDIIRETYDSSLRMGRSALEALGVPEDTARAMVTRFNTYDREAMVSVAQSHIVGTSPHDNPAYVKRVRELRQNQMPVLREELIAMRESVKEE